MFPLSRKALPATPADLRAALEESLGRVLRATGPMVAIEDRDYPALEAIRISLDGAQVGVAPPRPPSPIGQVEPALQVADFALDARPLKVQGAAIELSCHARGLEIGQRRDEEGDVLLLLQTASEGTAEAAVAVDDLEALVLAGARREASKQGVTVEQVKIELNPRSERALDFQVQLRAKKLFLSANVRITGSLSIDEQMKARLSGLACAGEGALGGLACGFISPHLQRFNGREFSLLALPLGEMKLRDVRIAAGAELRVTARFGNTA